MEPNFFIVILFISDLYSFLNYSSFRYEFHRDSSTRILSFLSLVVSINRLTALPRFDTTDVIPASRLELLAGVTSAVVNKKLKPAVPVTEADQ